MGEAGGSTQLLSSPARVSDPLVFQGTARGGRLCRANWSTKKTRGPAVTMVVLCVLCSLRQRPIEEKDGLDFPGHQNLHAKLSWGPGCPVTSLVCPLNDAWDF